MAAAAEGEKGQKASWSGYASVVDVDTNNMWYRACSVCERTVPDVDLLPKCGYCSRGNVSNSGWKRLYRVLLSIATDEKVLVAVLFDRAARVLLGCTADELFDLCRVSPFAAEAAAEMLKGEIFQVTLSSPKNGNAEHLRVVSVFPARSSFRPVSETLREMLKMDVTMPQNATGKFSHCK